MKEVIKEAIVCVVAVTMAAVCTAVSATILAVVFWYMNEMGTFWWLE
jgi:hypothetical protein